MNKIKCWEIKKCPDENFTKCAAYLNKELPCWEIKGLPLKRDFVK